MALSIQQSRIKKSLEEIAAFHEENSLYTRRAFTGAYQEARNWLKDEMMENGLSVHIDDAGNLIGKRDGQFADLPSIVTGSHIDTVANGGRYDGIVGVLAALEVIRSLNDANMVLNHPLEIVDFLAEEANEFGISTTGSKGIVGRLTPSMLELEDALGRKLHDCISLMGGHPEKLDRPLRNPGEIKAFIELHIEQGPILENNNVDIGVVTGIVGIHRCKVYVEGFQGHAGTVPMDNRQDALVTASKIVLEIQRIVKQYNETEGPLVGTVGTFEVSPNQPNVIPGEVTLSFELRSIREEQLYQLENLIVGEIHRIAEQDGCKVKVEQLSKQKPVLSDTNVIELIEKSAQASGLTTLRIPSGAGHDTSHVAAIAPAGMIFIPCYKGISHHPDEFTSIEQIVNGATVLAETILAVDHLN